MGTNQKDEKRLTGRSDRALIRLTLRDIMSDKEGNARNRLKATLALAKLKGLELGSDDPEEAPQIYKGSRDESKPQELDPRLQDILSKVD